MTIHCHFPEQYNLLKSTIPHKAAAPTRGAHNYQCHFVLNDSVYLLSEEALGFYPAKRGPRAFKVNFHV